MEKSLPYKRLSSFYLFYFATVGIFLPYSALFLQHLNFDPQSIGELIAITMATKIIAPNVLGWLADHTGRYLTLVRIGCLLAAVFFAGILWGQSYAWVALVLAAFSFFWNAVLPSMEAITLGNLGKHAHRYSQIRLWGSIGFIGGVIIAGKLFEAYGIQLLPYTLLVLFASIGLIVLVIPAPTITHPTTATGSFYTTLRQPVVIVMFVCFFLMQFSHGPFYAFFTIYLESHDYPHNVIGMLWALGVIAEILAFMLMGRLMQYFSLKALLLSSFAITALRWLLVGWFVDSLPIMILTQLMHAASFGVYHAVSIQLIRIHFPDQQQARAQALYSSVSFGLGGSLGTWLSGNTWGLSMGESLTYLWAASACLLAVWIGWLGLRDVQNPQTTVLDTKSVPPVEE